MRESVQRNYNLVPICTRKTKDYITTQLPHDNHRSKGQRMHLFPWYMAIENDGNKLEEGTFQLNVVVNLSRDDDGSQNVVERNVEQRMNISSFGLSAVGWTESNMT